MATIGVPEAEVSLMAADVKIISRVPLTSSLFLTVRSSQHEVGDIDQVLTGRIRYTRTLAASVEGLRFPRTFLEQHCALM